MTSREILLCASGYCIGVIIYDLVRGMGGELIFSEVWDIGTFACVISWMAGRRA